MELDFFSTLCVGVQLEHVSMLSLVSTIWASYWVACPWWWWPSTFATPLQLCREAGAIAELEGSLWRVDCVQVVLLHPPRKWVMPLCWGCDVIVMCLWTSCGQSNFHWVWASLRNRMVLFWVAQASLLALPLQQTWRDLVPHACGLCGHWCSSTP